MANHKITEEKFNEIKKFLDTPILINPPIRYVADYFGYSSGVITRIKNAKNYKAYKNYVPEIILREEYGYANEQIEKFNNEWYFDEKNDN